MYMVRFKTILNTAVQDKIIKSNPCFGVRIKGVEVLPKFLTEDEIRKLNAAKCGNENIRNAFLFSTFTGLRLSDVQNLKWEQITNENINLNEIKTGSAHTLPLSKIALEILKKQNSST